MRTLRRPVVAAVNRPAAARLSLSLSGRGTRPPCARVSSPCPRRSNSSRFNRIVAPASRIARGIGVSASNCARPRTARRCPCRGRPSMIGARGRVRAAAPATTGVEVVASRPSPSFTTPPTVPSGGYVFGFPDRAREVPGVLADARDGVDTRRAAEGPGGVRLAGRIAAFRFHLSPDSLHEIAGRRVEERAAPVAEASAWNSVGFVVGLCNRGEVLTRRSARRSTPGPSAGAVQGLSFG